MPIQWTNNPEASWPDGADGVSIAPSGSSWTFGTWVTVQAAAAADSLLTGIVLRTSASNANLEIEVQIGVGAVSSESAIATFHGTQLGQAFTRDYNDVQWSLAIPVDLIPSGARVAARVRVSTTSTDAYRVKATYYESPITGNLDTSDQPFRCEPFGASLVLTTASATPWTYGSWVELVASTATAQVIEGVHLFTGSNPQFEVQLGIGAAAAESPVAFFRSAAGNTGAWGYKPEMLPLDVIGAGVRVSARSRANAALQQVRVGYSYREKPL